MSILEWIEIAEHAQGKDLDWYPGTFEMVLGDAMETVYGGMYFKSIGPYYNLVFDPEDLLLARFPMLEPLADLLSGLGGLGNFVWGSLSNFTYGGPEADVRRGAVWSKTSTSPLGGAGTQFQGPGNPVPPVIDPTADRAVAVAALALAAIMWGITIGLEMTIKIKYWKKANATGDQDTSAQAKAEKEIHNMLLGIRVVTSRLLAIIRSLEHACNLADFAAAYGKALAWPFKLTGSILGFLGICTVILLQVCPLISGPILIGMGIAEKDYADDFLEPVFGAAGSCLKYAAQQLKDAVAGE